MDDRAVFLAALALWDRPEGELHRRVLPADVDADAEADRLIDGLVSRSARK